MLLENLHYDPETGIFEWKSSGRGRKRRAGNLAPSGYRSIRINSVSYYEHRLAWLAVYGELPPSGIDHINGNPQDNRIANLRLASQRQNMANARGHRDSLSGLKGAHYHRKRGKWFSRVDGKFLGYFSTPQEAHAAYCAAAQLHFGEFARIT
jgi:hypothetical protein